MYQPEAYGIALSFMFLSMLCWGSWANTMKLTPGFAFQLFYWDYVIGIFLGSLVWGLTLGNRGGGNLSFLSNISQADSRHILGRLGSLHLERICQRSAVLSQTDSRNVYLLPAGAGIDRSSTHGDQVVKIGSLCRSPSLSSAASISI